jgi:hypothetical protein
VTDWPWEPFAHDEQVAAFLAKVKLAPSGCWEWIGARVASRWPYGQFRAHGTLVLAHRYAYEEFVGAIPAGMVVMHTCDNPPCVNPDHLAVGTQSDNLRDMARKGRHARPFAARTHCANGHEFTTENTYMRGTTRICRACARERYHRNKQRKGTPA